MLILLFHLGVVGLEKQSFTQGHMLSNPGWIPPPCSIQLAFTSFTLDFLVFRAVKGKYSAAPLR